MARTDMPARPEDSRAVGTAPVAEPQRRVDETHERPVQRDETPTVSDAEARAAHERTEARLEARERHAAQERIDEPTANRTTDDGHTPVDERPAVVDKPAPVGRARSSVLATLGLMVGLTSVLTALTGRLAPIAVVVGVIGVLLSFGGLAAVRRPRVAAGGLSMLALVLSVGGAVLGILAMTHSVGWLSSDVDQVARVRDWLDTNLPFMRGW